MDIDIKPLEWCPRTRRAIKEMPEDVQGQFGHELFVVQAGDTPDSAKFWKGDGSGVYELVADYRKDTYRAVYTVRFERAVYVFHCFQKKSKTGIATPKEDVALIKERLKWAEQDYAAKYGSKERS